MSSTSSSSSVDYIYDLNHIASSLIFYEPVYTSRMAVHAASIHLCDMDIVRTLRVKPYYLNAGGIFAGYVAAPQILKVEHGTVIRLVIEPRRSLADEARIVAEWREHVLRSLRAILQHVRTDYGDTVDTIPTFRMYI